MTDQQEQGSDQQLGDEALERIANKADLEHAAQVEEERKTSSQPVEDDVD